MGCPGISDLPALHCSLLLSPHGADAPYALRLEGWGNSRVWEAWLEFHSGNKIQTVKDSRGLACSPELLLKWWQRLIPISQNLPLNCSGQWQVNLDLRRCREHVPPFWQGFGLHTGATVNTGRLFRRRDSYIWDDEETLIAFFWCPSFHTRWVTQGERQTHQHSSKCTRKF